MESLFVRVYPHLMFSKHLLFESLQILAVLSLQLCSLLEEISKICHFMLLSLESLVKEVKQGVHPIAHF